MSTTSQAAEVPTRLEDFRVGQRLTAHLALPGAPGTDTHVDGAALAAALAASDLSVGRDLAAAWRYLAPVRTTDEILVETTVTACRRTPDLEQGVVTRHIRFHDDDGGLCQEGTVTSLVPVRSAVDDEEARTNRAFGTRAWATALAALLDADPAFRTETSTWDGTIGIGYGEQQAQFRVYKGRVLEAGTRTVTGATFAVEAGERDWVDLLTGPANDFVRRAMMDQFAVTGNAYEYLRLQAAVVALVDRARDLAGSEGAHDAR
ncbi:hypothetical protein [Nocardioides sp. Soil796]|uniref:hypothetical protein n=1 Tax=Nocardioides sp. Soil796 TaxID=1736412 RepID=UPI00070C1C9D|nr:hypothetical protein [Nocardioides sp. Soil796]KRF11799.1 hypothetical protein ASH02_17655 [Nocardioides sp. Soil796]